SNVLYFGGQFTQAGLRTGGGVPVSAITGQAEPVFAAINGLVYASIPDGQGGWFVGGAFLEAGGFLRTNLVHIKSDRSLDQIGTANAPGGPVYSLYLSGNILYVGGAF